MRSLSLLSSLRAIFCALVRLGLGRCEDLRTLLISALSSSASCWLSLVQAASMAVMYSKLGGCLGVTAKLGPLARTDLCAGVKGLLERLMTHLGFGSSLEEPWLVLLGGVEEGVPSLEVVQASGEGWEGWCLGECLVPCLLALGWVVAMPCLGCPRGVISSWRRIGLGRIVFFPCGSGIRLRGRGASFWGKVCVSQEIIASFPRRKVSNCQVLGWGGGTWLAWLFVWLLTELLAILLLVVLLLLLVLLIATLLLLAWLLGRLFPSSGRWTAARGELSPFPGRKESSGWGRVAGAGARWGLNLPV